MELPSFEQVSKNIQAFAKMLGIEEYFRGVPTKVDIEHGYSVQFKETIIDVILVSVPCTWLDKPLECIHYAAHGINIVDNGHDSPPEEDEFTITEACASLTDTIFNVFVYIKEKKFSDDVHAYYYQESLNEQN